MNEGSIAQLRVHDVERLPHIRTVLAQGIGGCCDGWWGAKLIRMDVLGACPALVGAGTLVGLVAWSGNPEPVHCHSWNAAVHDADCHRHRVSHGTDSSLPVEIALEVLVRDGPAPRDSTLDESRQACHTPLLGAEAATRMRMHRTEPQVLVFVNSACDRRHSWQAWNEHVRDERISLEQDETAKAPREPFRGAPDARESRR
jgi:hypothetical protein